MALRILGLLMLAVILASLSPVARTKDIRARENLNEGVLAYRAGAYPAAIHFFQEALRLDPRLTSAELYRAMAYAQQFVPGTESERNEWFLDRAIEGLEKVLDKDPRNIEAVQWLASIYQESQQHTKAREYFIRLTGLNPSDPTAFYMVGVVNWIIISNEASPLSAEDKERLIAEGLKNLDSALAIDREFDEAAAYKKLYLRQQAELAVESGRTERSSPARQAIDRPRSPPTTRGM